MNKNLSGCLREVKNKRKVWLGNTKSGRGRLRSGHLQQLFIYLQVEVTVQTGFHIGGRN